MDAAALRAAIDQLPPLPPTAPVDTWLQRRIEIRRQIREGNPDHFLQWSVIRACMFVGNAPYIDKEAQALGLRYWHVLAEPMVGRPPDIYTYAGVVTSGNLVHQAYHLAQWELTTGRKVEDLETIVEFGGGYGALALLVRRLGFRGQYIAFDFPEMALLQRFYLSRNGHDITDWNDWSGQEPIDLLVGLYSLSEVEPEERVAWLEAHPAASYLIRYSARWDGWDNRAWADAFAAARPGHQWATWAGPHFAEHWYLVGDSRGLPARQG